MSGLTCIALTAGLVTTVLPTSSITLKWYHSVENVPWEEDYVATSKGLQIKEARVVRSGAGMDPPPSAQFDGKWWRYTPDLPLLRSAVLANSLFVTGYDLCWGGSCIQLSALVPKGTPVQLGTEACSGAAAP